MREPPKSKDFTGHLLANYMFYPKPQNIPGSICTFWYKHFAISNDNYEVRKRANMF